ncbi:MAG: hypothetical protein HYT90_02990 [Candidatus Omnitrophica bacterium]|nr:hypothetical protein [Candidatus Omnitrophota bacterium]
MYRLQPRKLLLLVALLACCPSTFGDGVTELQEIYTTPIPAEIRRNFDRTIRIHDTCPECHLGVLDGEKFIGLYTKKFLVVGVSPNSFGGVWAVIAVEGEPRDAYRLWLYDVENDEYDLRSIEELPEFLEEKLVRQLLSPEYRQYWL